MGTWTLQARSDDGFFGRVEVQHKMNQKRAEKIRRYILEREKYFFVWGSICKDMVRCGKPNCKCARGQKHGPYYYLYRRIDDKAERFYLGGPEEAEVARQTLLEIRRKSWRGHDHCWHYRRYIKGCMALLAGFRRFMLFPSMENLARLHELDRKVSQLRPAEPTD